MAGFDLLGGAGERCLVKAHACHVELAYTSGHCNGLNLLTVREVGLEKVVVSSCDLGEDLCQVHAFLVVEVHQGSLVRLCNDHNLKRPGRPPGAAGPEAFVLKYRALALFTFEFGVVLQEVAVMVVPSVLLHALQLNARLLRQAGGRPDLTVWVGVRATHSGAFVLEDLHVAVLVLRRVDKAAVRSRTYVLRFCDER